MIVRRLRGRAFAQRDLVRFVVGQSLYALPVADVVAVVRPLTISSMPNATSIRPGFATHRGVMLEVVDLRSWFLATREPRPQSQWIIVEVDAKRYGCIVDRVVDIAASKDFAVPKSEHVMRAAPHRAAIANTLLDGDRLVFVVDLTSVQNFVPEVTSEPVVQP